MSTGRTCIRMLLTLTSCAVLAACANQSIRRAPKPTPAVVTPIPKVPLRVVTAPVPAPVAAAGQPWAGIVANDVMHDCADSRLIRANAAMYTRYPARFEQLLKQSLPLILYVHKELQAAGIPGEFAMLPMLESSYNAGHRGRHGGAAGMWQFMPATARRHGVVTHHQYDGRLDPVATTRAAIKMLTALHRQFGDWRLVDMAYNAGPGAIAAALRKHPKLGGGAIPAIPVSAATRTHLARLMALSCILREPQRFHVSLPHASADDTLVAIKVPAGTQLKSAADMAGLSETRLRALNPGYLGQRVVAASPRTLLLPADAAELLAAAMTVGSSESVAQVDTREDGVGSGSSLALPDEPVLPGTDDTSADVDDTHRVRKGETLWSIARDYDVSVGELKRWNDLHGNELRIGEQLRISG